MQPASRHLLRGAIAAVALFLLQTFAASASPIVGVTQNRTASVFASNFCTSPSTDSDSSSAPDFSPYLVNLTALVNSGGNFSIARARHDSNIGGAEIYGELFVEGIPAQGCGGEASANSFFDVTFDVTESVPYDLSALGFIDHPGTDFYFEFSGPGGTIAQASHSGTPGVSMQGVLSPGQYRILAEADVVNFDDTLVKGTTLEFTLTVPQPGTFGLLLLGLGALATGRARRLPGPGAEVR